MTAATVAGRERLRLFCALRLPDAVLDELERWGHTELAERVVTRANLHITLAFLSHRPSAELPAIVDATFAIIAGFRLHAFFDDPLMNSFEMLSGEKYYRTAVLQEP